MLTGRKLALTLAFAVLVAVACGVSCKGFFQPPTLTSITINPTAPSVQLGDTTTLQAYVVNSNGEGNYATSGVSWSSSDDTIATVTGTGSAVLDGLQTGTVTITAASESVTNTATATVYITVSSMAIKPTSQSISTLNGTTPEPFIVTANGSTDISSGAILTVYLNGVATTDVTCTYNASGAAGAGQYCTGDDQEVASPNYQVVASYTGTNITATATLNIQ
ncbi:MAG: Ig-like domain-containing protein [Terriglobales bacterium]